MQLLELRVIESTGLSALYLSNLRAIACKLGESDYKSENSGFLLWRQKHSFGELFSFRLPVSSHFCEIQEGWKYRSINQNGRWNLCKIAHFQQDSTKRSVLSRISYLHFDHSSVLKVILK